MTACEHLKCFVGEVQKEFAVNSVVSLFMSMVTKCQHLFCDALRVRYFRAFMAVLSCPLSPLRMLSP